MRTIQFIILQLLLIILLIIVEINGDITVESVYKKVTELENEMNTLKVIT